MIPQYIYTLFVLLPLTFATSSWQLHKFTDGGFKNELDGRFWRVIVGDVCQLGQLPRPFNSTTEYLECIRTLDTSNSENVGIWAIQKCIPGNLFSEIESRCAPFVRVRRQQVTLCNANPQACQQTQFSVVQSQPAQQCGCQAQPVVQQPQPTCMCPGPQIIQPQPIIQQPIITQPPQQQCGCQTQPTCPCAPQQPVVQPQPCPQAQGTGGQGATENGICSWMLDPLAAIQVIQPGHHSCNVNQHHSMCSAADGDVCHVLDILSLMLHYKFVYMIQMLLLDHFHL